MYAQFNPQQSVLRQSKTGALAVARACGLLPATVIDVGAQTGTLELLQVFPESRHILIEPVQENEPHLKHICSQLAQAEYVIAGAWRECGTKPLLVSENSRYSSIQDNANVELEHFANREIPVITLDYLAQEKGLKGPYLIKIDVDGREVDVIEGARSILPETALLVIEATISGNIHPVIDAMRQYGFTLYDILEPCYRQSDGLLGQIDLVFAPERSKLREGIPVAKEDLDKCYVGV